MIVLIPEANITEQNSRVFNPPMEGNNSREKKKAKYVKNSRYNICGWEGEG